MFLFLTKNNPTLTPKRKYPQQKKQLTVFKHFLVFFVITYIKLS